MADPSAPEAAGTGEEAARLVRLADVEEELATAESRSRRHLLFALLGVSPAAAIPLVGFLSQGALGMALGVVAAVGVVEGVRGVRASRRAERLRELRDELAEEAGGDLAAPERSGE